MENDAVEKRVRLSNVEIEALYDKEAAQKRGVELAQIIAAYDLLWEHGCVILPPKESRDA